MLDYRCTYISTAEVCLKKGSRNIYFNLKSFLCKHVKRCSALESPSVQKWKSNSNLTGPLVAAIVPPQKYKVLTKRIREGSRKPQKVYFKIN